jgi:large subunit ribosomal protein L17
MRHRVSGRGLTRTSAHNIAMRRNLAQSLFEHGQIRTTLPKAKEVRRFVERLITIAREGGLRARQRVIGLLSDRAVIPADHRDAYDGMSRAYRQKVLMSRSGRRHRTGAVPAAYNKKKFPFVAGSIVHRLMTDVAPRYKDAPGGYTRIIRLADHRIGDNGETAILQLVGTEQAAPTDVRKPIGHRRKRVEKRLRMLKSGKRAEKPDAPATPPTTRKEDA